MTVLWSAGERQRAVACMHESRALDERMLMLLRQGHGHFWTGGPGEEAFNVALGMSLHLPPLHAPADTRPEFDFLLPHYRSSAIALATGESSLDFLRQFLGRATDPYSCGRNFSNHFGRQSRNLGPVSSPVTSQFLFALGTARAQKLRGTGLTVCVGGDASTQSGDFASLLVWASRPRDALPILIVVTNNRIGISTPWAEQHAEGSVLERGRAFGIDGALLDGLVLDTCRASIQTALAQIRATGRPYLLEVEVPRLYGHSSSSGAKRVPGLPDPLEREPLTSIQQGALVARLRAEAELALSEPMAVGSSATMHEFADANASSADTMSWQETD